MRSRQLRQAQKGPKLIWSARVEDKYLATDRFGHPSGYTIERHGKGYWAIYFLNEPLRVKGLPDPTTRTFGRVPDAKAAALDHAVNAFEDQRCADRLAEARRPLVPR